MRDHFSHGEKTLYIAISELTKKVKGLIAGSQLDEAGQGLIRILETINVNVKGQEKFFYQKTETETVTEDFKKRVRANLPTYESDPLLKTTPLEELISAATGWCPFTNTWHVNICPEPLIYILKNLPVNVALIEDKLEMEVKLNRVLSRLTRNREIHFKSYIEKNNGHKAKLTLASLTTELTKFHHALEMSRLEAEEKALQEAVQTVAAAMSADEAARKALMTADCNAQNAATVAHSSKVFADEAASSSDPSNKEPCDNTLLFGFSAMNIAAKLSPRVAFQAEASNSVAPASVLTNAASPYAPALPQSQVAEANKVLWDKSHPNSSTNAIDDDARSRRTP